MLRRLLICLAFATWCFLDTWVEYAEGGVAYFARQDPLRTVMPVLCLEGILTLGLFVVWELCRRRGLTGMLPVHFGFVALCFVPLRIASVAAVRALPFDMIPIARGPWFWPSAGVLGIGVLAFVCLWPRRASWLMRTVLLYSWPVLLLVQVQAARRTLLRYPHRAYQDSALADSIASPPVRIRVVWIIFDELSQTIAFDNRPANLALPEFDRLRAASFYASAAESPADSTEFSMPSLILGEQVIETHPEGPGELRVRTVSGGESRYWSSMPNVFDTARGLGLNSALVGWFHPYGRVLNHSLTKSYWTAGWLRAGVEERSAQQSLAEGMLHRMRLQFAALPLLGRFPGFVPGVDQRRERLIRFSWLRDRALEICADPSIGLALIHLPVPHAPAIFDRFREALTAEGGHDYLDSVALADRTLAMLRQSLEQSGLWDRTAILVSADHGWRTGLWRGNPEWTPEEEGVSRQDTSRVPFLLKLPGQTSGLTYNKRFNTIVTRQVITGILKGQLIDIRTLPEFIERSGEDDR